MEPFLQRSGDPQAATRNQLRGLISPTRTVFMDGAEINELPRLCQAISLALAGHAVFTHLTSAALRRWQLPEGVVIPIIAVTDKDAPHHNRRGAYIRRCDIPPEHRELWEGVAVASAEWTIVELAEDLSLLDLVALIDSALHLEQCTVESIWAALVPGRRGVRTLRRALSYVDDRSESWWESILRMLHELCGIRVEPQREVFEARGRAVARLDLWIVGTKRYPEYDGGGHRELLQHRDDLRREKAVSRLGLERYGYTASEIRHQAVRILRDAEEARGLAHDVSRLKWWLAEAEQSTITPAGRRRLYRKLKRFDRDRTPRPTSTQPRVAQC